MDFMTLPWSPGQRAHFLCVEKRGVGVPGSQVLQVFGMFACPCLVVPGAQEVVESLFYCKKTALGVPFCAQAFEIEEESGLAESRVALFAFAF